MGEEGEKESDQGEEEAEEEEGEDDEEDEEEGEEEQEENIDRRSSACSQYSPATRGLQRVRHALLSGQLVLREQVLGAQVALLLQHLPRALQHRHVVAAYVDIESEV